jgi:hypothetical protein
MPARTSDSDTKESPESEPLPDSDSLSNASSEDIAPYVRFRGFLSGRSNVKGGTSRCFVPVTLGHA